MRKHKEDHLTGNLTAMIDVVFQLIIFFVCTSALQDQTFNADIKLAMSPNGTPVTTKNPYEIRIDVDSQGRAFIGNMRYSLNDIYWALRKAANECGAENVPIIIRGDGRTKHHDIKLVMDECTHAGMYRLKFAAMKDPGKK